MENKILRVLFVAAIYNLITPFIKVENRTVIDILFIISIFFGAGGGDLVKLDIKQIPKTNQTGSNELKRRLLIWLLFILSATLFKRVGWGFENVNTSIIIILSFLPTTFLFSFSTKTHSFLALFFLFLTPFFLHNGAQGLSDILIGLSYTCIIITLIQRIKSAFYKFL